MVGTVQGNTAAKASRGKVDCVETAETFEEAFAQSKSNYQARGLPFPEAEAVEAGNGLPGPLGLLVPLSDLAPGMPAPQLPTPQGDEDPQVLLPGSRSGDLPPSYRGVQSLAPVKDLRVVPSRPTAHILPCSFVITPPQDDPFVDVLPCTLPANCTYNLNAPTAFPADYQCCAKGDNPRPKLTPLRMRLLRHRPRQRQQTPECCHGVVASFMYATGRMMEEHLAHKAALIRDPRLREMLVRSTCVHLQVADSEIKAFQMITETDDLGLAMRWLELCVGDGPEAAEAYLEEQAWHLCRYAGT
ncbi:hypothetical protein LTS18_012557 [Coniosporium uncinatum]|uniref:Uncharacterized protein n=1 Tax=Coniosporium uncinatum TaxID=93489 RepID=A0ACC3D993_9PEZI|nr:hypothetical protein LTS18_012557 [Coniosporium uncinatum]